MATATAEPLEIEVDSPKNQDLKFRPLDRQLRTRFDAKRMCYGRSQGMQEWPDPIPGQRIVLDADAKQAHIVEPLYEPIHKVLRKKIENRGVELAPERETFPVDHLPTWLHWMKRAVESGQARVVRGKLPEKIEGKPKLDYITKTRRAKDEVLAEAMNRQAEALEGLSDKIGQLLTHLLAKK